MVRLVRSTARPPMRGLCALGVAALLATACGTTVDTTAAGAAAGTAPGGAGLAAPGSESVAGLGPDGGDTGLAVPDGTGAAAAPGSVSGGGGAGGSSGSLATGRSGTAGPATAVGTGTETSGGAVATKGITATTVRVGFIAVDQSGAASASSAYGVPGAVKTGDPRTEINAIVRYINDQGGVAGRKVDHVIEVRDPQNSDPNYGEAMCAKFAQDHKVFAVVTNATLDAEACYAKNRILLLNDGVMSAKTLSALSPYIWVPGQPTAESGYAALLDSLVAQKWFDGAKKLGFIGREGPVTLEPYRTVVQPRLERLGFPDKEIERLLISENADTSEFQAAVQGAVLKFKTEGVDHVFFMIPGGGAPLIFMNQAQSQAYTPRYAFSSFDTPGFVLQAGAPPTQLRGSLGAGWFMTADVDASRGDPYPSGPAEEQCHKAVQANGDAPPPARAAGFTAAVACDGAFLLQAAGVGLKDTLSPGTWAAAAERLDTRFQASYSLPNGTRFTPGSRAGGAFYRQLAFVTSCNCFQYVSGNKSIPR
jgi:ABC-type branched-subunit amino acid transport system substrate-binding protein